MSPTMPLKYLFYINLLFFCFDRSQGSFFAHFKKAALCELKHLSPALLGGAQSRTRRLSAIPWPFTKNLDKPLLSTVLRNMALDRHIVYKEFDICRHWKP